MKKIIEYLQSKTGISDYLLMWISWFKGIIFGLLIYHFLICN